MENSVPNVAVGRQAAPASIRPSSILRRAFFGLLALVIGVVGFAWLFHTAIESSTASANAPQQIVGKDKGRYTVVKTD